jgi:hypothetical protein
MHSVFSRQLAFQSSSVVDATRRWSLETQSISRLLSLLQLGGQTALVRIYPAGKLASSSGAAPDESGWTEEGSLPHPSTASWHAELYLQAGQLQYGAVFSAEGERKFTGEQALNFLEQIGRLSYELLPFPSQFRPPPPGAVPSPPPFPEFYSGPSVPPDAPSLPAGADKTPWPSPGYSFPAAAWRPTRTGWGETVLQNAQQNAQQLTRDQRRVLTLVNGQRTSHEIANLLGFPPEAVYELLVYFRDQKLIF